MKLFFSFLFIIISPISFSQSQKILSIAHRGASGIAPENTLAAFQKAIDLNADFIELDVHQTKDSALVVIHDRSINRTTNGKGKIKNLTLDEIKKYSAGKKFGKEFSDEKIPTLEEVIKLVNSRAILFIELKKGENFYPGIEKRTVDLIRKYNSYDWCYVQSNSKNVLKKIISLDSSVVNFKSMLGKIPLFPVFIDNGINSSKILEFPNAKGFTIHYKFLSKKLVKEIHKKGKLVFAWTINDDKNIARAIKKGADGIITNFPEKVKK